jgi:hypothetical protein
MGTTQAALTPSAPCHLFCWHYRRYGNDKYDSKYGKDSYDKDYKYGKDKYDDYTKDSK